MTRSHLDGPRLARGRPTDDLEWWMSPRPRQSSDWGSSTLAAAALLILEVLLLIKFPLVHRSIIVQIEQIALSTYSGVMAASCLRQGQPRVVQLIAWLWVYTLFGLVQIIQLSKNDNPFHVAAPDVVVSRQLFIMLIGCLAFHLTTRAAGLGLAPLPSTWRQLSLRRTIAVSLVTVLASPVLVSRLGGVQALFGSRVAITYALRADGSATEAASTSSVILLEFANVAPFLCAFALWRMKQAGVFAFRDRPDIAVLFGLLLVSNIFLNNPISQARFWIATIVVALAIAGKRLRRIGFQASLIAVYIVASIVLFPFLDLTRYAEAGDITIPSQSLVDTYINKTDYGSAQDVSNAISYVDDHGHTDGRQILGSVLFFVPRTFWPSKPYDTARLLATQIGYTNLNLDSPLWAEGYIDFGYAGVIGVLGVFGWAVGRADRVYVGGLNPGALSAVLVPAFAGYELILLRGSLLQATGRLGLLLAVGWIISKPAREVGPGSRAWRGRRSLTTNDIGIK